MVAAGTPAPSGSSFSASLPLLRFHGYQVWGQLMVVDEGEAAAIRHPRGAVDGHHLHRCPSCRRAVQYFSRRIPPARPAVAGGRATPAVAARRAARGRRLCVMVTGRLSTRVRNSWAKLRRQAPLCSGGVSAPDAQPIQPPQRAGRKCSPPAPVRLCVVGLSRPVMKRYLNGRWRAPPRRCG